MTADVLTPTKGLVQQATGSHYNKWGPVLNANFGLIDTALGGTLYKVLSGNVSLSAAEIGNIGYVFSGTLTAPTNVYFPQYYGLLTIQNNTNQPITLGILGGIVATVQPDMTDIVWSDGVDFKSLFAHANGLVPEAPIDGGAYARSDGAWIPALPLSGGTMLGMLTLAGDPIGAMDAATKEYVDTQIVGSIAGVSSFNTRTGAVKLSSSDIAKAGGVLATGETPMTGPLVIAPTDRTWPLIKLAKSSSGAADQIAGYTGANARWIMDFGDDVAETGNNAGSNFAIWRYNDAGLAIDSPMNINRATGNVSFTHSLTVTAPANQLSLVGTSDEDALIGLTKPASGLASGLTAYTGSNSRWSLYLGDATQETGNNTGSDFTIYRYNDAGAYIDTVVTIYRSNASTQFSGDLHIGGAGWCSNGFNAAVFGGGPGNAGYLNCWNSGNRVCFHWDGAGKAGLLYRVNEAIEYRIGTMTDACDLRYQMTGAGPTSWVLNGANLAGMPFSIFCATASDISLKTNIAPTKFDALALLRELPVDEFDIKADVTAWMRTMSDWQDPKRRRTEMRKAEAHHVPLGFVADKIEALLPCVHAFDVPQTEDSPLPPQMKVIALQEFVPYLVRAMQQMANEIDDLKAKLSKVEKPAKQKSN